MAQPSLKEAKKLAEKYGMIPVAKTMYADIRTPVEVLKILKSVSRNCYMLESLEDPGKWGRYTFLGYDPKLEITCAEGVLHVRGDKRAEVHSGDPGAYIEKVMKENRSPGFPHLPPFAGGLVGYFSYDFIKYSEPSLRLNAKDEGKFKDFDLKLFDKVIAFDHFKQTITLIANVKTDNLEKTYEKGLAELESMARLIAGGAAPEPEPLRIKSDFRPLFDREAYCRMVEKAKEHIFEGDIFQVVLSNRLEADVEGSLLDTYRVLRTTNPSPYMFYISSGDMEIAGASPETLVKLQDGTLHTFPLAGTRPRGKTEVEDLWLEKDLLSDPKELAEHNMLVDLGRNDLGKISKFGTVTVEEYLSIERFSHVMHIGSTVSGKIRDDKTAMDAVRAVLPAGTLSGAPKIRACEIIDALEDSKRGIYGGAVGYLSFTGNMDTCIAIRIAFKVGGKAYVRSGAGIVGDSVPEREFDECIHKARAVLDALRLSEGGLDK